MKSYDEWYGWMESLNRSAYSLNNLRFNEWLLDLLGVRKKQSLLDVGCGQGALVYCAMQGGVLAKGIDFSAEAIKSSHPDVRGNLSHGRAERLPFGNEFFDFVCCVGSLGHFQSKEKALKEMARVLKKNGSALILVPNSYFVGHVYLVWKTGEGISEGGQGFCESFGTLNEWKDLIEGNGFIVEEVHKHNKIWESARVGKLVYFFYNFFFGSVCSKELELCFCFYLQEIKVI